MKRKSDNGSHPNNIFKLLDEHLSRMKERNVLERDIAAQAGIDPSTLSLLKTDDRIKVPSYDLRMRLAIAFTENLSEAEQLAQTFFLADPRPTARRTKTESPLIEPPGNWRQELKEKKILLLQSKYKRVEFGLPLFFDTAPFLVAEKNGLFERLGIQIKFEYVRWHKALDYVLQPHPVSDSSIRLSIYNLDSIEYERREDAIAFCVPLAVYEPESFAFWVRDNIKSIKESKAEIKSAVRCFFDKTTDAQKRHPKIIVSGTDMKRGVESLFKKVGASSEISDDWFLMLDQFEAIEVFIDGYGDAYVGGVPQRLRMERGGTVKPLATGKEIGLKRQYNGIVCANHYAANDDAARRLVGQILWAWYQALSDIDRALEKEAEFIVKKMNIHSNRIDYKPEDFIKFWKQGRKYFHIPRGPSGATQTKKDEDYGKKDYDYAPVFVPVLSQIEELLPAAG